MNVVKQIKRLKPSEEKAWLKHYKEGVSEIVDVIPETTVFDFLEPTFKKHGDQMKIKYKGSEIPWSTIEENADLLARTLRSEEFGVEPDMVVPVYAPFIPGMAAIIKAMNDTGICPYFLKMASSLEDFKEETLRNFEKENSQAKMANVGILFDGYYKISKDIREVFDDERFKKVLVVSAVDFLEMPKAKIAEAMFYLDKVKNRSVIPNNDKYIRYNEALKIGSHYGGNYKPEYKDDRWFAITTSSGTSMRGVKPVILTNKAVVGQMIQCKAADFGFSEGETTYTNFPPTTSTSLVCLFSYALYMGNTLIMDPEQSIGAFYSKIMAAKPNNFIAPGTWIDQFFYELEKDLDSGKVKSEDLSFINNIMMGGEGLPPRVWNWAKGVAARAGIPKEVMIHGWGLSEGFAPMAKEYKGMVREPNTRNHSVLSVGPVMPAFSISAYDENGNELDYNEPGEIQATSKLITPGYYNKLEATKEILGSKTEDGKVKLMTGDYGYVDENGEVFIIGRMNDAVELINGKKLQLPVIANKIRDSHSILKDCIVLKIPLEDGSEKLTVHLASWVDHQFLIEEAIQAADKKMEKFLPKEVEILGYWNYGRVLEPSPSTGKRDRNILVNQSTFYKPEGDIIKTINLTKNEETKKYEVIPPSKGKTLILKK